MSFETGRRMGVAEGFALVFALTFPRIFLSTPVHALETTASLAWLVAFCDIVPALVMFLVLSYISHDIKGDLITVAEKLIGKAGAWFVGLYFLALFMVNYAVILRQFTENTLITALPKAEFTVILAYYAIITGIIVYYGIEGVVRGIFILTPFSLAGLAVILLLLAPYYDAYNLAPYQGTGLGKFALSAMLSAGSNVGVFALMILAKSFQNKTIKTAGLLGLGVVGIFKALSMLVFTMVFGVAVGTEKILPFYEMARLVYLSRYLQRVESLFIVLWVIQGLVNLAVGLYLSIYILNRLVGLSSIRPLIPVVSFLLLELAMMPTDVASVIVMDARFVTGFYNIGIYVIPSILLAAYLLKRKKRREKRCAVS